MRNLGAMGEDTFSFLCNSVGLVANGSKIDKTGWDFFVEFPGSSNRKILADMEPTPIECRVQVKSTDNKDRKVQINLKNMNRLVKAQMPSFICLIEFHKKNKPQALYLTHIDQNLIEKTLKRLRKLSEKNITNFNKRKITISFSEKDKIEDVSGEALRKAIEKHIPEGLSSYVKEKDKIITSAGFESGWAQINFDVIDENPVEKMVDLTLGLVDEVKVSNFIGRHSRFNILSQKPFFEHKSGKIKLPDLKPDRSCSIKFKESKYGPGYSFKAKLYSSPFNKFVPEEYIKIRVEWSLFNLVFKPYTGECNFKYSFTDDAKETTIKDLFHFLNFLDSLARNQDKTHYVELSISDKLPPLEASFNINNFPVIDLPLEIVSKAHFIAQKYRIENSLDVNLFDILKYSKSIAIFYDVVINHKVSLGLSFKIDSGEIDLSKQVGGIFFISTKIGKYAIGCVIGAVGKVRKIEGEYEIYCPERRYFRDIIVESEILVQREDLLNLAHEIAQEMERSSITPVILME